MSGGWVISLLGLSWVALTVALRGTCTYLGLRVVVGFGLTTNMCISLGKHTVLYVV